MSNTPATVEPASEINLFIISGDMQNMSPEYISGYTAQVFSRTGRSEHLDCETWKWLFIVLRLCCQRVLLTLRFPRLWEGIIKYGEFVPNLVLIMIMHSVLGKSQTQVPVY